MFQISAAKEEILEKLATQDRNPTDLAAELGKSRETVYNHLQELHEMGVLTKTTVPAKTRPKTKYSIGDGFVQYISLLPDQFTKRTVTLSGNKEALFRIWDVPQESFHPYLEQYWWTLQNEAVIAFDDILGLGVFGSVARGEADRDSDIDLLLVVSDSAGLDGEELGTRRITVEDRAKICMTELYTETEYRNTIAEESDFLKGIADELHVIYDSNGVFTRRDVVVE